MWIREDKAEPETQQGVGQVIADVSRHLAFSTKRVATLDVSQVEELLQIIVQAAGKKLCLTKVDSATGRGDSLG